MSWDADIYEAGERAYLRTWNYTHNCNAMIAKVLTATGHEMGPETFWMREGESTTWWDCLDGLSGEDGYKLLDLIVNGLMEAPTMFRAMNPANGWGDYDSLLGVLVEMRDMSARLPAGEWSVHG